MSEQVTFTIDDRQVTGKPGQTILDAAQAAGVYIPRLCHKEGLTPWGGCRICTVLVNGRPMSACTQPIAEGMIVENDSEMVRQWRKDLVEMLFVEGNHFCMFCEKSGRCELQALAYRMGIAAPKYPYLWPKREVDATHPDIFLDHNRCVLCARCVRTSRDVDGKHVFGFVGRGPDKRIAVNAEANLGDTDADISDRAVDACPVGAILRKRVGFEVPVGQRLYDLQPIGSDIESPADGGEGGV
jgi:[NiFe] hydrogenase diaphorase moiety small subunit